MTGKKVGRPTEPQDLVIVVEVVVAMHKAVLLILGWGCKRVQGAAKTYASFWSKSAVRATAHENLGQRKGVGLQGAQIFSVVVFHNKNKLSRNWELFFFK